MMATETTHLTAVRNTYGNGGLTHSGVSSYSVTVRPF